MWERERNPWDPSLNRRQSKKRGNLSLVFGAQKRSKGNSRVGKSGGYPQKLGEAFGALTVTRRPVPENGRSGKLKSEKKREGTESILPNILHGASYGGLSG